MFALIIALGAVAIVIPAVLWLLEARLTRRSPSTPEPGETPELLRRPLRSRYLT